MPSTAQHERSYLVYGFRLVSEYDFEFPLSPLEPEQADPSDEGSGFESAGPRRAVTSRTAWPTYRFDVHEASVDTSITPAFPEPRGKPIFDDRRQVPGGVAGCAVYETRDYTKMRFNEAADFYLSPGRITCHLYDQRYRFAIEIWLLGTVLAYLLEKDGTPVLHASAVEVDGRAVGFLASNKGGKSSLAVAFVQANRRLVSDDFVGVSVTDHRVMALPGYPQLRMWPEQAAGLLGSAEGLAAVQPGQSKLKVPLAKAGPGSFRSDPLPLAVLYLPERGAEEGQPVTFEPMAAAEAMAQLTHHSFLASMLSEVGSKSQRFQVLTQVLKKVPVRRLRYPSGLGRLPEVVASIVADVTELSAASRPGRSSG